MGERPNSGAEWYDCGGLLVLRRMHWVAFCARFQVRGRVDAPCDWKAFVFPRLAGVDGYFKECNDEEK